MTQHRRSGASHDLAWLKPLERMRVANVAWEPACQPDLDGWACLGGRDHAHARQLTLGRAKGLSHGIPTGFFSASLGHGQAQVVDPP